MRKWFRQNWMALPIIAIVAFAILVCLNGCTKNTTVTGPSNRDTVMVTKIDTVTVTKVDTVTVTKVDTVTVIKIDSVYEVQKDIKSLPDFYDALQGWINPQLAGADSYYPTIGTQDIEIDGSATVKSFDVYWVVIDSDGIWAFYGVFEVTYKGNGKFTFKDTTPAQMPQLSRGKLATRKL